VRLAFYIGAAALLTAVLWTIVSTREYSPEEMRTYEGDAATLDPDAPLTAPTHGFWWAAAGAAVIVAVDRLALDKPVLILGAALMAFGAAQAWTRSVARSVARSGRRPGFVARLMSDIASMPEPMKRLALAQFFTWIALFIMWIYMTPVVTKYAFGSTNTASSAYNNGADWVGVMFAVYNGVAALAAFLLPPLARRIGLRNTHALALLAGALGFALILLLRDPVLLLLPMLFVGIAWASILTMPYAILASVLPQAKFGTYMGVFNIFIVLPQLMVSALMGSVMKLFFPGEPLWTMLVAALVLALAAAAMLRVAEPKA
jgi:maltose/moltooligosaccharide transporter